MKRTCWSILLAALVTLPLPFYKMHAQVEPEAPGPRFEAVDIVIDPRGAPLAAYQFELTEARGRMTVVGIESGEHPAYPDAPHYDSRALASDGADRVIVADYTLRPAAELPTGPTRIATVHVRLEAGEADYQLNLVTAGNPAGQKIPATATLRTD